MTHQSTSSALLELAEMLWRGFCCAIGRHRYFIIGRCGIASHHVGCRNCAREWGMNHDVRSFLPWIEVAGFHIEHGYDPITPSRATGAEE